MTYSGNRIIIGDVEATPEQEKICGEALNERSHQDEVYGGPEHDDEHTPRDWCRLLELRVAYARIEWGGERQSAYRHRMVQVIALAMSAIESFDRKAATGYVEHEPD